MMITLDDTVVNLTINSLLDSQYLQQDLDSMHLCEMQ